MTLGVIAVMLIMIIILALKTASYNNHYADSIDNLTNINYIKSNIESVSSDINNVKIQKKTLDDVKLGAKIDRFIRYINDVQNSIESEGIYDSNVVYANTVCSVLEKYKELYDQIYALNEGKVTEEAREYTQNLLLLLLRVP